MSIVVPGGNCSGASLPNCTLSDIVLVAGKWPWWEHVYANTMNKAFPCWRANAKHAPTHHGEVL